MGKSESERFWSKVDIRGKDECWPWTGSRRGGYGLFRVGGKILSSHRVMASWCDPNFDPAAHYLHSCDNPPCCNPAHVSAGTHAQNVADMTARGRNRTPRPGNGFGRHKIEVMQYPEIRRRFAAGENKSAIARHYGVSPTRVRQIIQRGV
jgi:hypothetical protein